MFSSQRPRSTRQALAGLNYATSKVARPNPIVLWWRWRWELAVVGVLTAAIMAADRAAGAAWTAGVFLGTAGLLACWPAARRFLAARAWCVITAHRVRRGCAQAWIHSRIGKIPIVLLTSPTPLGERVRVWCRAGTSVEDFTSARPLLASACWARDVLVTGSTRYAQLVTLEVIRREPRAVARSHDLGQSPGVAGLSQPPNGPENGPNGAGQTAADGGSRAGAGGRRST